MDAPSGPGDSARPEIIPPFGGEEIVRLFALTYLPLCRSLQACGLIEPASLARRIAARAGDDPAAPWSAVALSLAAVLTEDAAPAA